LANGAHAFGEIQQFQSDRMSVKLNGKFFVERCAPVNFLPGEPSLVKLSQAYKWKSWKEIKLSVKN